MSLWTLLDILLRIYHLLTQLFSIFAILGHFFLPFYPHRKWGGKFKKEKNYATSYFHTKHLQLLVVSLFCYHWTTMGRQTDQWID